MRQGTKHQLGLAERRVFSRHEGDFAPGDPAGRAALFVRRCKGERQPRMTEDECTELAAGITAGPEHSHWNLIHEECIIMHLGEVNPSLRLSVQAPSLPRCFSRPE